MVEFEPHIFFVEGNHNVNYATTTANNFILVSGTNTHMLLFVKPNGIEPRTLKEKGRCSGHMTTQLGCTQE